MKAIFITMRMGSTRLPNKSLVEINGVPAVVRLINSMKRSKQADKIILCTTLREADDPLCNIAAKNNIDFFRGSEEDKLERWRGACRQFGVTHFYACDGDDLFSDPELIDKAFQQMTENKDCDFLEGKGLVCGAFTYVIKTAALETVCDIKNTTDTEIPWMYFTETGRFNVRQLTDVDKKFYRNDIRMTLDYPLDLTFFENMVKYLEAEGKENFTLEDIVNLIDKRPEMAEINIHLQEDWKNNQSKKIRLELKDE